MQEITTNMKASEIEVLKKYKGYLMYKSVINGKSPEDQTLEELNENIPAWNKESMRIGIERVCRLAEKQEVLYKVYDAEKSAQDPEKNDVRVWHFPSDKANKQTFIILNAGGAYNSVCSMCEAFPVAAELNKMGYHVFAVNYRVGNGAVPKALDDLAAAYTFIIAHKQEFQLHSESYAVCGFSAGASLTSLWGTKTCGYKKYGLRKPEALFLIYPPFTREYLDPKTRDVFDKDMYGEGAAQSLKAVYDISKGLSAEYPPSYIVHCEDDDCVPVENGIRFKNALDELGVKSEIQLGKKGGHGFGDGRGTDVEGWIKMAIAFAEGL